MTENAKLVDILLVEDSPTDAELTQLALIEGKIDNNLHRAKDGAEALAFLRREGIYAHAPRPDLVLLDLNLPRISGLEVLGAIRADPNLKSLVVVVLTSSREEKDVIAAYGLNSNAYISKPVDVVQFFQVVKDLDNFYFRVVTLPPKLA